jgi:hypothetical protein
VSSSSQRHELSDSRQETVVDVVVRLHGGDTAEAGRFADYDEAKRCAASLVKALSTGVESEWPLVGGRFLRPGAVLSVDLVENEGPRWAGSNDRASTWTGRQGGQDEPISLRTTKRD